MATTTNTKPLKWTKLAPGSYEAVTGPGERDRFSAMLIEPGDNGGYGRKPYWALIYPREVVPDTCTDTLRQCKAFAQREMDEPIPFEF